jgi:hypothetical protein
MTPLRSLKSRLVPVSLRGPVLLEASGIPRFWPIVWSNFLAADDAPSTVAKKLGYIERLFDTGDSLLGIGGLDRSLASVNIEQLFSILEALFTSLRSRSPITKSSDDCWRTSADFVVEVCRKIIRSGQLHSRLDEFQMRLAELEQELCNLHAGLRRSSLRIRSLPADVLENLYEMLDPDFRMNPFRKGPSRWLVYLLFILMLHAGLRRSECLVLPADFLRGSYDPHAQCDRHWFNVAYNEYEDEERGSPPELKNRLSIRPISSVSRLPG